MSSTSVTVRAPGKVNLQLSVGARRADGYHPLVTIFQAVELYELVTATPRADGRFTVTCDAAPGLCVEVGDIPLDETNLAIQAARAVAERYLVTTGVDLHIAKAVPVAGGMAGGSADAAAALVACAEAWEVGATRGELLELAATLGSDVPFALHGHTALGTGRGEELSPAMTRGEFHWVFATQAEGLSTRSVFEEFDRQVEAGEREVADPRVSEDVMAALMAGDPRALGAALTNDLHDVALSLAPRLRLTVLSMKEADALGVVVSGSGPTVAALASSRQHALVIAAHTKAAGAADAVWCASGPAAGATILRD